MPTLPRYDELPIVAGGARSGWGLFGKGDSVGLINLLTPERVLEAVRLVSRGAVFPLNAPVELFNPPFFMRDPLQRETRVVRGVGLDETYNGYNPQASSQWDGLAHYAFREDEFYNGATLDDVMSGRRNGIEHWARRGIVGRGVLLDLKRHAAETGRDYSPGTSHAFTPEFIEEVRVAQGIEFEPGDIMILRTGFIEWYQSLSRSEQEALRHRENLKACGIAHGEAMAEYLWNTHACAVASDCPSLEVWPLDHSDWPFGTLHHLLIAQFGMALGELWWLDDLAADCAQDRVYRFLIASAPMNAPGGFGSGANALAIK